MIPSDCTVAPNSTGRARPGFKPLLAVAILASLLTGCSTYHVPGARADLQAFAPEAIQEAFAAVPSNPFPAAIAAVRVQAPGYTNHYLRRHGGTYGKGRYSVILTREVEEQEQVDRITALPQVNGLTGLNRLLLPQQLDSDAELRTAAARLHADLLLIYTFDTVFSDHDKAVPLSVITLGLSPTRHINVSTTVSALLLDTRTGYIYTTYEATERESMLTTSWGSTDAADAARLRTERKAFAGLVDSFVSSWPQLLARHAPGGS
jgi:hypothetical protein